jgi:hypothetical protein
MLHYPQAYDGRSIVVRNVNCLRRIYCDSEFPCTLSLSGTLQISSFRVALLIPLHGKRATGFRLLSRMRHFLNDTRFPDEVSEAYWAYGVPLTDTRRDGYDWRAHGS